MKRKRRRSPIKEEKEEKIISQKLPLDKAIKDSGNLKEKNLIQNANKYLILPKNKNQNTNNPISNSLIKNIPKNPFFNFFSKKKEYNINFEELYDDKNKIFYQIRNAKILIYKYKKILFIHFYNKLILFEISNDSYNFLTEIPLKEKLGITSVEKFSFLKSIPDKNKIYLTFTCHNEIILSELDMINYDNLSVLNKQKIADEYGKGVYKMINDNKMVFDGINLVTFFPKLKVEKLPLNYSEDSYFKNIAIINEQKGIIGFCSDMEIFIYDINNNKKLGKIIIKKEISSYYIGIKKYVNNKNDKLFILYTEKGVYLFDYENKTMDKKLLLEGEIKTKIRKIKQINNYLAILFNYYNLVIYNTEQNIITYKFKSNWTKSPGNDDFPILVKMSNDILLFGSSPFNITVLNFVKGDILGNISDKENKRKCESCKCIKMYEENLKKFNNDTIKEIYAFIKNSKTSFILKLSS